MLKVLFISNGIDIERGAFEFVKEMNRRVPVFLYEVFLPKRSPGDWLLRADPFFLLPPYKSQTQERLVMAACRFSDLCREYDIRHSSYLGKGEAPVSKLENESRYADLLVLGDALFQQRSTSYRWPHLAKILRYCEYLVIVVPDHFQFSNGNVIAFDGSASAVYALKQFSYLLPDLVATRQFL
ncbi:hypothetical protein LL912_02585 [Niabella sp. CC-SYL272]|uniref:hypothetical protein n=1 Tax=Niabella agricola TaxID=2891571 RepID=UPI001F1E0847|nr:hypothetical protein [Niabella agricola]MCF3107658.1 hypothetical protein [Niabella agricola]